MAQSEDPAFRIRPSKGRGLGMFAARKLSQGERILEERPLVIFNYDSLREKRDAKAIEKFHTSISHKIMNLKEKDRQGFFALSNAFTDITRETTQHQRCLDIVFTNSVPITTKGSPLKRGIFLKASRINHACNANAFATFNDNTGKLTVHITTDTPEGSEITLNYIQATETWEVRQRILSMWKITCTCRFCSEDDQARNTRDQTIIKTNLVFQTLKDMTALAEEPQMYIQAAFHALQCVHGSLVMDALFPQAFYSAFQVATYHGDAARAAVFAARTYNVMRTMFGDDHLDTKYMAKMTKDPTADETFGKSQLWASKIYEEPRGCSLLFHQRWLWRLPVDPEALGMDPVQAPSTGLFTTNVTSLENKTYFPAYHDLPCIRANVDKKGYYTMSGSGTMYQPTRHWCFLAEIVHVITPEIPADRIEVKVRDRRGEELFVAFHMASMPKALTLQLLPGFTIAILYASQTKLPDADGLAPGVIQSNESTVQVHTLGLDEIFAINSHVQANVFAPEEGNKCHNCKGRPEGRGLEKCSRCFMAWYCSRTCQVEHWKKKGHKKYCKHLSMVSLRDLFLRNWAVFQKYEGFA